MNFEALKRRVERSEQLVEGRALQTHTQLTVLKTTWRDSWTPTRIILAGLAAGFLVGRSNPTRALRRLGGLGGTRWIELIGSLSGLFASLQASVAVAGADDAAGHADAAVDAAADVVADAQSAGVDAATEAIDAETDADARPRSDRRRPDPSWTSPPSPAEAATELSEP